jgi:hypothetical protein
VLSMGCGMATGKCSESGHVIVDAHWRVACAAIDGECMVGTSPVVPRFVGATLRPRCSSTVLREKYVFLVAYCASLSAESTCASWLSSVISRG